MSNREENFRIADISFWSSDKSSCLKLHLFDDDGSIILFFFSFVKNSIPKHMKFYIYDFCNSLSLSLSLSLCVFRKELISVEGVNEDDGCVEIGTIRFGGKKLLRNYFFFSQFLPKCFVNTIIIIIVIIIAITSTHIIILLRTSK